MDDVSFQIAVFFRQFSFLISGKDPIVDLSRVERVGVKRIDESLLERIPKYDGATGSLVGIDDSEEIFLLGVDGSILAKVKRDGYCRHNEAHCEDESWSGESVGEALLRSGDPDLVCYIVLIHTGFVTQDHYSVGGYDVTMFLRPKNFTLKSWLEKKLAKANALLAASIAEINAD